MSETPDGPAGVRASDAEREEVAAQLGRAVGEGRLTLAEFSDRVGKAHAARTRAELATLTADLPTGTVAARAPADQPGVQPAFQPAHQPAHQPARTTWWVSLIGGVVRKGPWRVPEKSVGVSLIGGASLDLTDAEFAGPEVVLTRFSLIGGISAKVPAGVRVEVEGFTLIGGRSVRLPAPAPGAPVLRLRLFSLIGGVSVKPR